jgi:Protein of unknown function (DUF938)
VHQHDSHFALVGHVGIDAIGRCFAPSRFRNPVLVWPVSSEWNVCGVKSVRVKKCSDGSIPVCLSTVDCFPPGMRHDSHVKYPATSLSIYSKFEEWLHTLDPGYGIRDLEKILEAAKVHDLELVEIIEMPVNNLSVILRKKS